MFSWRAGGKLVYLMPTWLPLGFIWTKNGVHHLCRSASEFVAAYISLPLFISFFIGWKVFHKTRFVTLSQMDFESGRRELDLMDAMEKEKHVEQVGKFNKLLNWVCFSFSLSESNALFSATSILRLILFSFFCRIFHKSTAINAGEWLVLRTKKKNLASVLLLFTYSLLTNLSVTLTKLVLFILLA